MNGKFNEDGFLYIERKNSFNLQCCPFQAEQGCGDWCPLCGEPVGGHHTMGNIENVKLSLCKKDILFDTFVDERE